jgi:hypothetical protein
MLEHTEDPIRVLLTWLRKVKQGGIVYIAIPDKRHCFDRERPNTDFEHLERDHREGPGWSRLDHFREFTRLSAKTPEDQVEAKMQSFIDRDYRIHFHVWEQSTFLDHLLKFQQKYWPNVAIEHFGRNHTEIVAVLRSI